MSMNNDTKLNQALLLDMEYQRMLIQAQELEPQYERILAALPENDRELLERYISLGEEMEYRKLKLALEIK